MVPKGDLVSSVLYLYNVQAVRAAESVLVLAYSKNLMNLGFPIDLIAGDSLLAL